MATPWEQRITRYVSKLLSLRESTSLEVLPDLMPVLPTIDPAAAELLLLRDELPCWGMAAKAAVAGQYSIVGLTNPATSGVICTIDLWQVYAATGNIAYAELSTAVTLAAASMSIRDGRRNAAGEPKCTPGTASFAASQIGAPSWIELFVTNTAPSRAVPLVLTPGWSVLFELQTVNVPMQAAFAWRERPLVNAGELNA